MKIGIALLAYNRPKHLKKVIDAIVKEKIKSINIYIDGPADKKVQNNQEKILKVLKNYKSKILINLIRQTKNNGLAFSVTNAVTSELKYNDAVILLEDDCVPLNGFFDYMIGGLKKYRFKKNVRSVCSYNNLDIKSESAFFLKRFNPWGWATWKDRWKKHNFEIKNTILQIKNNGSIDSLPLDLKSYCENSEIINGKQDIWSLSWTLTHYLDNSLILYPSHSYIENIGFDGTGVHCSTTSIFKTNKKNKKCILPKKVKFNLQNETKYNSFLLENSSKTFFKKKKLDIIEPYTFIKNKNYILGSQIKFYIEKFVNSTPIFDIHTHLFPSKFKKYYNVGLIKLLNYHYLKAELFSLGNIKIKNFNNLDDNKKANIIWDNLFLNRYPISTATQGVLRILKIYGVEDVNQKFDKILKITNENQLSEEDIFKITNINQVVMTNNPFNSEEKKILNLNKDSKYLPSIRIDDLFIKPKSKNEHLNSWYLSGQEKIKKAIKEIKIIIQTNKPSYFSLSTENFKEFENEFFFKNFLSLLKENKTPMMLLIGVKRGVNKLYNDAGDGIGTMNLDYLEKILIKFPRNKFLVSCLDYRDQFKLSVLARKFQNLKIVGFWWFNNNESIIENLLKQRFELLGDNFIVQHSDARIIDQLVYKWLDFKSIYIKVMVEKYQKLLSLGYKIKATDLERKINFHFEEMPKKNIRLK
ncbi:glycosyltransferase family 2 protein [Candidatus Pelagibacter sp.]|nr:glycosyltransferase family 2 protein [Candidatus Pelagibacter sp.]